MATTIRETLVGEGLTGQELLNTLSVAEAMWKVGGTVDEVVKLSVAAVKKLTAPASGKPHAKSDDNG
jgi:hypothetical protein